MQRLKNLIKQLLTPYVQRYGVKPSTLTPAHWGLVDDADQGLMLQDIALEGLANKWGTPLHVVDADALRANIRRFTTPNGKPGHCEIFYSYKTNPIPAVLRELHAHGIGAEVISHYELWLAQRLGVSPQHIVFNGPGKSDQAIRDAIELGVQIINLNHVEEITRVATIARTINKRARVGLRVTTGGGWTAQFGTPTAGGEALAAFALAKDCEFLDVVGVHAHLGGMIHSEAALRDMANDLLDFVALVEDKLGLNIEILNFGGSLASPTVGHLSDHDRRLNQTFQRDLPDPPADSLSIETYVTTLSTLTQTRYQQRNKRAPRVFIEPGRGLTSNTQMLLTSVMSCKQTERTRYLILDAGINLAESVRSEFHKVFPVRGWREPNSQVHTLVGPICSPGDTLIYTWRSRTMNPDDLLVIMDAGAYFVPFATSFSFPQPAIVMLDHGKDTLIRRAETFDDLVAYDQLS